MLIEETYGYNKEWILTGEGKEKQSSLSLLKKVNDLSEIEAKATLAFLESLSNIKLSEYKACLPPFCVLICKKIT